MTTPPPPRTATVLQHVPFEGLGSLAPALADANVTPALLPADQPDRYPDPHTVQRLILLGGPMSVNDTPTLPWLAAEETFIRAVLRLNRPVLGICLGAQWIAKCHGARVFRNPEKEIGWFPIFGTPTDTPSPYTFPPSLTAFHWHGETFDLPPGATRLAHSQACANQAFHIGPRILALQFHLETTPEAAAALVRHCRHELTPGPAVQSETELLRNLPARCAAVNPWMTQLLTHWLTQNSSIHGD